MDRHGDTSWSLYQDVGRRDHARSSRRPGLARAPGGSPRSFFGGAPRLRRSHPLPPEVWSCRGKAMSIRTHRPQCGQRLRVPEERAGRRLRCPRCNEAVSVEPADSSSVVEDRPASAAAHVPDAASPNQDEAEGPWQSRFGLIAAIRGLASVLVLCLPLVGYVSIVLSSVGLLVGLCGLFGALRRGAPPPPLPLAGGAGVAHGFGARAIDFPLARGGVWAPAPALAPFPLL